MSAPLATVRIAVAGCGTIAYWTHLRTLRRLPGARLVAAADPDPAARARAAQLTGLTIDASLEALLARPDVDAVVLATPSGAHAEGALAACRAGKPFYVEKPLATSAENARQVLVAARERGLFGVVGFNRRLHPIHARARELLARSAIGRVRTVLSAFCEPHARQTLPDWKRRRESGGGALLDLGSHHVDLVRWFLDDEVAEVAAKIESAVSEGDSAWLELRMRGGAEVRSAFSFRSGPADWMSLIGEHGTLTVDRFRATLDLRAPRRFGYGLRRVWLAPRAADAGWRLRRLVRPSHEPSFRRSLAAFVDELRGGPARNARLADGARCLAVLLAAEESARLGHTVAISDEDPADH